MASLKKDHGENSFQNEILVNLTRPGDSTVPTAVYQHFHSCFLTVNFPELQPISTVTARQSSL